MIAAVFAACLVVLAGVATWVWRQRPEETPRPHIPKVWPLLPRLLVNSKERQIWTWLSKVMPEQQIMIKLPVTRFTIPAEREGAEHWYNLLNRVYCTFTLCNLAGEVIGCVDVPGSAGLSMSNQTLKYGLLTQCGIPYWVVEPDNLPHKNQIRAAFLGEQTVPPEPPAASETRMKDVAEHLQAAVSRPRKNRDTPDGQVVEAGITDAEIPLGEDWENNSFMAPLDSRVGELRKE
jgi:hypothetical protein